MNKLEQAARPSQKADASLEPVAWAEIKDGAPTTWMWNPEFVEKNKDANVVLYAAPLAQQDTHATHVVRTKDPCHPWQDLTDDELNALWHNTKGGWLGLFRAVIAADREKNR